MTLQNLSKILDKYEAKFEDVNNFERLSKLRDLPFYHWDKSKDEQQGTFVDAAGLPVKNGIEHGFYDYEQRIINYLESDNPEDPKNRHLYILKSSGLGITTLLLYYIGWKSATSNEWKNGRVCILTAPRLELTIDLVDRLKGIFSRNDLLRFDSRNTVCNIGTVKIEAFPSHLGLKGMRGLTDIRMIVCDEASFFEMSMIQEARDTIERYFSKSNPITVLVSTPNRPGDLMDLIKQEPEDRCVYHRMYLDYRYGLGKIYTGKEIELQRYSPSFLREMDLQFLGAVGNTFSTLAIDRAIERGLLLHEKHGDKIMTSTPKSLGLDPGFGSSSFGVCLLDFVDDTIRVLEAFQIPKANFDRMISISLSLVERYQMRFDNGDRIYIDASAVSYLRSIKARLGEQENYQDIIEFFKNGYGSQVDTRFLERQMFIVPINFATMHKALILHLKMCLERDDGHIAINPSFKELIIGLRSCISREYVLDKVASENTDIIDAMRMACYAYG